MDDLADKWPFGPRAQLAYSAAGCVQAVRESLRIEGFEFATIPPAMKWSAEIEAWFVGVARANLSRRMHQRLEFESRRSGRELEFQDSRVWREGDTIFCACVIVECLHAT